MGRFCLVVEEHAFSFLELEEECLFFAEAAEPSFSETHFVLEAVGPYFLGGRACGPFSVPR